MLGKIDADLENPRAYLIRAATNLWIDRVRRSAREQAILAMELPERSAPPDSSADQRDAAKALFQSLHPQERAAILMKDVFDLSLEETAAMLRTSVGAVKSALSRARGRLDARRPPANFEAPPAQIVDRFMRALSEKDMATMQALCSADLTVELVGGAQGDGWEQNKSFFIHAHMVMPALGFGEKPWWKSVDYEGERIVLGFRTLDGVEGLNEVHRLEVGSIGEGEDRILRIRCYCFCPETVADIAREVGVPSLYRPHRSPSVPDLVKTVTGLKRRPKMKPTQGA